MVLAALADPGNLGTIIRSAEAAGVEGVVIAGGVDPFNPKCVRASAGAIFFVPVALVDDGVAALDELGSWGMRRIGTRADADRRYDEIDLRGRRRDGARQRIARDRLTMWRHASTSMVSIPMAGQAESLNVAGRCCGAVLRGGAPAQGHVNLERAV